MHDRHLFHLGLVWTLTSTSTAALGGYLLTRDRRFKRRLVRTSGHIVATLAVDDDGATRYQPMIEYRVDGGARALRTTDSATYDKVYWRIGDARRVDYDPAAPATAIVDLSTGAYTIGAMLAGMGLLFTLMGVFFLVAAVLGPDHPVVRFGSQFFGDPD